MYRRWRRCATKRKPFCIRSIKRKLSDFYTAEDVDDPPSPDLNLTIENFNDAGEIVNPNPPCVATDIDPNYISDCNIRQRVRKFLMKSDILQLRDITRTKFSIFSQKERALRKHLEKRFNDEIHRQVCEFYQFGFVKLKRTEHQAFGDMKESYKELNVLQQTNVLEECRELELRHQRVLIDVTETYRRFRYLLTLITYFDNVISSENDENGTRKLGHVIDAEMSELLSRIPQKHGPTETLQLREGIDHVIKPYLERKNFLNVDSWKMGYEDMRKKVFDYNRHLSNLATVNHVTQYFFERFMSNHKEKFERPVQLKDVHVVLEQTKLLEKCAAKNIDKWEGKKRKRKKTLRAEAIVPLMVTKLNLDKKILDLPEDENMTALDKTGKIQERLLDLLHTLDSQPPTIAKFVEREVRNDFAEQQLKAKQALVIQNRMENLKNHYRNHFNKKGIVDQYTTLIRRHRGRVDVRRESVY